MSSLASRIVSKAPRLPRYWSSSSGSRNALRANLIAQSIGTVWSVYTVVPVKFSQVVISLFVCLRQDLHGSERLCHFMQAFLALSELVLSIFIFFKGIECSETDLSGVYCKVIIIVQLLYAGVLSANSAVSEISKDVYTTSKVGEVVI